MITVLKVNLKLWMKKWVHWVTVFQLLWGAVYMPVQAQVPPSGEGAGDWNVYRKQTLGSGAKGSTSTGMIANLLIILDTSDSMNQPESWRPYPGGYNSHVEYLWNDPVYISEISTKNPVAPGDLHPTLSDEVRVGYFTYLLKSDDAALTTTAQKKAKRVKIKHAALESATGTFDFDFNSDGDTSDTGESNLPNWIYRNYGGPIRESWKNYGMFNWFSSNWIFWTPSKSTTSILESPYLLSTSFSRFLGNNSSLHGTRASISYFGDMNLNILQGTQQSFVITENQKLDLRRFNLCETSRYDNTKRKLTGFGNIAYGLSASTVYSPYTDAEGSVSGIGYTTGYAKDIKMVRFDPYWDSTQTRQAFINEYPGAGHFDDNALHWPSTSMPNYFNRIEGTYFIPGYLDLRCWNSAGTVLDVSKYLAGTGVARCDYTFKNEPRRDNFHFNGTFVNPDTTYRSRSSSSFPDFFNIGKNGLPIRLLRYKLVSHTGDNTSSPSTRKLKTNFGGCASSLGDIGPGRGYDDYLCTTSDSNLWLSWSRLRSDSGGFVHSAALHNLYSSLLEKQSVTPGSATTPSIYSIDQIGSMEANRLRVIDNMLEVYDVKKFKATSSRWGKDNTSADIVPNEVDKTMFAAYLGTRDCVDSTLKVQFTHCTGYSLTDPEMATGVPAYMDSTRTTYHKLESSGLVRSDTYSVYKTLPARDTWTRDEEETKKLSEVPGSFEMESQTEALPPYKRGNLQCLLNTDSFKHVFTEAPRDVPGSSYYNDAYHYYTEPKCTESKIDSSKSTCLKLSGGSYVSVPELECTAAGLSSTTGCDADDAAIYTNIMSRETRARRYETNDCGQFFIKKAAEGASSALNVFGKSCMPISDRNVGTFRKAFIVDWDNPLHTTPSALSSLKTKYSNFFGSVNKALYGLPHGDDSGSVNFFTVSQIKRSIAIDGTASPPSWSNIWRPSAPDLNLCDTAPVTETSVSGKLVGFEPVFINSSTNLQYNVRSAGVPACNAKNLMQNIKATTNVASLRRATSTSDTYIRVKGSLGYASYDSSNTAPILKDAATTRTNVASRLCSQYLPVLHASKLLRGTYSSGNEHPYRVFEVYNVLNFYDLYDRRSNRLELSSSKGSYMRHLIHACRNDYPKIGEGHIKHWKNTSGLFGEYEETVADISKLITSNIGATHFIGTTPSTFISNLQGTKDLSTAPVSTVNLYSVNYLNYLFGPKYNDAPIGRRTRIQMAKDVLANFIATTGQIRVGLMFFNLNLPDTEGGYIAQPVKTLEALQCTETPENILFNVSGVANTKIIAVDKDWIDFIPIKRAMKVSEELRNNIAIGGSIVFPDASTISMSGMDEDGVITLATGIPNARIVGGKITAKVKSCNIANYASLTGHRAALVNTIYEVQAISQTPLTETLYEAYLYFNGGTPKFGDNADAHDDAFVGGIPGNQYHSPMDIKGKTDYSYGACMSNNILIITDGASYNDFSANADINTLVSSSIQNDGGVKVGTYTGTSTFIDAYQFMDTTKTPNTPYEDKDQAFIGGLFENSAYTLLDELAYYMGNKNIASITGLGKQTVDLYTIVLDIECSLVMQNAIKKNRDGTCAQSYEGSNQIKETIENILNNLGVLSSDWLRSSSAAAIPLPVTNRSNSSIDSYMGLFEPENKQIWKGNMKKFRLGFGPKECGVDANLKPIDVCLTAKNILRDYYAGSIRIQSRNIFTRPSSTSNNVAIDDNAIDYWSSTLLSTPSSGEGKDVFAGGVASNMESLRPKYDLSKVYTFISDPGKTLSPNINLNDPQNQINFTNTLVNATTVYASMPSTAEAKNVINFMLGGRPSTYPSTRLLDDVVLRDKPHGDVMHSLPASILYKNASGQLFTRLFYLTGLGDLMSVKDNDDTTTGSNVDGSVAWRFYPEEALKAQYNLMRAFDVDDAERKMFGADGGVSTLYFDKDQDGAINSTAGDKVFIAFGLRRGGRAVYVLDVTDPDTPKLHWRLNSDGMCYKDGRLKCVDTDTFVRNNFSSSAVTNQTLIKQALQELGYTWSMPVMGFVNKQTNYSATQLQTIYNIKKRQSVVIFGGGYDPQEDRKNRDPASYTMGRALYVFDLLTGVPQKIWYRTSSASSDSVFGRMIYRSSTSALCDAKRDTDDNPFHYPIPSKVYAMNVDYDTANTIDRLYVGDTGGQLFRFDIGLQNNADWRGTLMGEFNDPVTAFETDYTDSSNMTSTTPALYKKSRKFLHSPVVATWRREDQVFNYIYALTSGIEHPWESGGQDIAITLLDPEIGLKMKCAPVEPATVGIAPTSGSPETIFQLADITNVGRADKNTDNLIDQNDILNTKKMGTVTRDNLSKLPKYNYKTAKSTTEGLMGWFYRMLYSEKPATSPRVINGQLTWTTFASEHVFGRGGCSSIAAGTGAKYYLDAYWGHTTDTNFDGKVSNLGCVLSTDLTNLKKKSLLVSKTTSGYKSSAIQYEEKLRMPLSTTGSTAGVNSLSCDSPRPIYNTSYGLLPSDTQVVKDGKIYRIGFVPQGNRRSYAYDDSGSLKFVAYNGGGSGGTAGTTNQFPDSSKIIPSNPVEAAKTQAALEKSQTSAGAIIGNQFVPAQLYWFRSDIQ